MNEVEAIDGSFAVTSAVRPSAVRWRVFAFLGLLTVVNLVDRISLLVGMPVISRELGSSPVLQGIILNAFFWTYAARQVPGGWLIDRLGPSRMIAAATLLWGLFQALVLATTGAGTLLATRLGLGAAEAPLFPSGGAPIGRWLAPRERVRGAVILAAFLSLPHVDGAVTAVAVLAGACFMLCWGGLHWSFQALLAPGRAGLLGGLMNMAGSCGGTAVPILVGFFLQGTGSYDAVLVMLACCAGLYMVGTLAIPRAALKG